MPPKLSPIWRYFEESPGDPSTALCKVPGCKNAKVSRGKQGCVCCLGELQKGSNPRIDDNVYLNLRKTNKVLVN